VTTPPPGQPPRPPGYPLQPPQPGPGYPTQPGPGYPTAEIPRSGEEDPERRWWRDPLSLTLVSVIVAALALAGLLGAELFARQKADSVVASAVSCVVQDRASASFGPRPFLLQHFTGSYRDMRVETAGNQIREAKGMKLRLRLDDVRINPTAESAGTLGSLDAQVTWSADGIKDTVSGIIPLIGGLVSEVSTDPAGGTIEVQGPLGTVTVAPAAVDGTLQLGVTGVTGLGFTLPSESVQPALDAFTKALTANLPMGIRAEDVAVTENGVEARFGTRDATIPTGAQDPCFAGL
jgi:hypothetical protein